MDVKVLIYQQVKDLSKANVINTINITQGFLQNHCEIHYYLTNWKHQTFYEKIIRNMTISQNSPFNYPITFFTISDDHELINYLNKWKIEIVYIRDNNDSSIINHILQSTFTGYVIHESHDSNVLSYASLLFNDIEKQDRLILSTISPLIADILKIKHTVIFPCAINTEYFANYSIHNTNNPFNPLSINNSVIDHDKDPIQITYCGHLYPYKGIDLIIEASKRLPNYQFNLIGGRTKELDLYPKDLKNLKFYGSKEYSEIPLYLKASDLLLIPYTRAGNYWSPSSITSPIKLFEYLSVKKPVLCSDIEGIRNWVTDQEVTFFKADDIEDFIEKLTYLAENLKSEKILSKVNQGFLKAECYSTKNKCHKLLNYVTLLKNG